VINLTARPGATARSAALKRYRAVPWPIGSGASPSRILYRYKLLDQKQGEEGRHRQDVLRRQNP
jgi:hypothetical protein